MASTATVAQLQGLTAARAHQHDQGVVVAVTGVTPQAGTQGRGGFNANAFTPATATQTASTSTSSRSAWIAAGVAAAAIIIVIAAWALVRRRRQPSEVASAAFCAQHPDDALCRAV